MSNKNDIELDDWDLDDDLDFGSDFDPPTNTVPDSRDAVMAAPVVAAKSAANQIIGEGKRKQLVLDSLPEDYRVASNAYDTVASEGKEVYREAVKQLNHTKRDLKRVVKQATPTLERYLPGKLASKIKSWSSDDSNTGDYSKTDPREGALLAMLEDTMGAQRETEALREKERVEEKLTEEVKERSATIRQDSLNSIITNMRADTAKLVAFNQVTDRYRRKMLEVSWRQYYTSQDLLQTTRESMERLLPGIDSIVKNTALPDYAKEQFSEITSAMMKRNLIENIGPGKFAQEYLGKLSQNLQRSIGEMASGARDVIEMGNMMVPDDDGMSSDGMMTETQKTGATIKSAAGLAGGQLANRYINPHLNKLKKKTREYFDSNEELAKPAARARDILTNLPEYLNDLAKNPEREGVNPLISSMASLAGGILPVYEGDRGNLGMVSAERLAEIAPWTRRSDITVNEVIPEWLSKIHHGIVQLGGGKGPREVYDYNSHQMVSVDEINQRLNERLADNDGRAMLRREIDSVVDTLTEGRNVDGKTKQAIARLLDEKIRTVSRFNIQDLSKHDDAYGSLASDDSFFEMKEFFESLHDEGELKSINLTNDTNDKLKSIRGLVEPIQDKIDSLMGIYGNTALARTQFFNKTSDGIAYNSKLNDSYLDVETDKVEDIVLAAADVAKAKAKSSVGGGISTKSLASLAGLMEGSLSRALYGDTQTNMVELLQRINSERSESPESHSNTLDDVVVEIREQLKVNNLTEEVGTVINLLNDLIANGIAFGEPREAGPSKWVKRRSKLFSGIGSAGRWSADKIKSAGKFAFGGIPKVLGGGLSGITGLASGIRNGFSGVADIRDDEGNIVLFGKTLKAGGYFDKDGNVIKAISDIVGAVYDKDGNVILSEEEVREKKDKFTLYSKGKIRKLSEFIGKVSGSLTKTAFGVPVVIASAVSDAFVKVKKRVTTSKDIFVKGETSPRLQKILMMKNFYIDRNTGKPVRSVKDITGPILNKHKETVISQDEFDNPDIEFVDVNGKPFTSLLKRTSTAVKSAISFGKNKAMSAKDYIQSKFKSIFGSDDDEEDSSSTKKKGGPKGIKGVNSRLDKIYKLLNDRLVKPKKAIFGDTDGDGLRDGGFRDVLAKRRAAKAAKKAERDKKKGNKVNKPKSPGSGSLLSGMFAPLKGVMNTMGTVLATVFSTKALSMLTDGIGSLFKKIPGFGGGKGGKPGVPGAPDAPGGKKGGFWSKTKKLAGKAARWGSKAAMFVGRQVLWQGVRMAGAAAVAAVGTISAPVVAGIAAVGLVGYGLYRWLTDEYTPPLMRLRMAHYGTEDYDDAQSDEVKKLLMLEEVCIKNTSYDVAGIATLKGLTSDVTTNLAKEFGIDLEDQERIKEFELWLHGRFVPAYLLWTTRVKQIMPGVALPDIDNESKVEPELMAKLLKTVSLPTDHPIFKVMVSPFGSRGVLDTMGGWVGGNDMLDAEDVKEVEIEVAKLIEAKIKKQAKSKTKQDAGKNLPSYLTGDKPKKTPYSYNGINRNGEGSPSKGETGVPNSGSAQSKSVKGSGSISVSDSIESGFTKSRDPANLNAVESIRVKTYGLKELKADKVALLWQLEERVMESISGSGTSTTVSIDIDKVAKEFMPKFGMRVDLQLDMHKWKTWFESRFLPVLLRYITSLRQFASNANPLNAVVSTSTTYMLDVALAMIGTRTQYMGEFTSVWFVDISPFGDIDSINMDSSTTDGNVKYLRENVRQAKVMEQTLDNDAVMSVDRNDKSSKKVSKARPSGTSTSRSILNEIRGGGEIGASSGGAYSPSSSIPMDGFKDPTADPNGAYAKIKLNGNDRESVAMMIKEVAKVTGVDENLLLTIAMMESSMNPMAGAKTSSAKGLYQFINATWKAELGKHGNKYGIPATAGPYDAVANALLGAEYLRSGAKTVETVMPQGQKAGPADLYLAHFLGPGGARKFLRGLYSNPDRIAALDFTAEARANQPVFTDKGRPRSYREVHESLVRRAENRFSYVSKWADKKELTKPAVFASNEDANSVNGATTNPITSDRSKANASLAAMSTGAKREVTRVSATSAAPTSSYNSQPTVDVNSTAMSAIKESTSSKPTQTPTSVNDQTIALREELHRVSSNAEKQLAAMRESLAKQAKVKQADEESIALKQLKTQELMLVHLQQINEKLSTGKSNREIEQMNRDHQKVLQQYTVTHDRGPVSLSRKS